MPQPSQTTGDKRLDVWTLQSNRQTGAKTTDYEGLWQVHPRQLCTSISARIGRRPGHTPWHAQSHRVEALRCRVQEGSMIKVA